MLIRLLSGHKDTIDALIVAAEMEGIWSRLHRSVAHYTWSDLWHIYRVTGIPLDADIAWHELVMLSHHFDITRKVGAYDH